MGEKQIAYMKYIKIQSCHMGVIFAPNFMIWQRQKCVRTHSHIVCYHNGNDSDSTLRSLFPPQFRKMMSRYEVVCGCECYISDKSIHSSLLSWRYRYLKKLKYIIQNTQNRRSGEKSNSIYETCKNTVMPHGHHI